VADAEVKYETKTVRAIRGMEARTVTKWEADGWVLVSQTPGKLQTEIAFRRPKPKSRWLIWAIGGGVLAVVFAVIITFGIIGERGATSPDAPSAMSSESPATPSPSPSLDGAAGTSPSSTPEDIAITPERNADLAALLTLTDYCDPSIAEFASTYRGQTISFPGSIGALTPHDGATTRYDILIGSGDFSETSAPGPAFQFRDVNTTNDLNFVGPTPDTIGVGTNLSVTAEVDDYEPNSCLLLLNPMSTAVR